MAEGLGVRGLGFRTWGLGLAGEREGLRAGVREVWSFAASCVVSRESSWSKPVSFTCVPDTSSASRELVCVCVCVCVCVYVCVCVCY